MQERYINTESQPAKTRGLTPKQIEILNLIAQGFQKGEIAKKLGIAADTVSSAIFHPEGIHSRLGTNERIETILKALKDGLLNSAAITERFDFDRYSLLTDREVEFYEEIISPENYFLGNKGIANKMGIDTQSLKNSSSRIYTKLGVKNRVHAILFEVFRPKN